MQYYVVNKLDRARVVLLNGSVSLDPKGSKGDTRRVPSWARNHPDILSLEKSGKVEILDENEYRARLGKPALDNVPAAASADPAPAPRVEEAVEPVEEDDTPEEEEATPEPADDVDEDDSAESTADLMSLEDFKGLNKQPQLDYLKELDIFEEDHAKTKADAEAAYEDYLKSSLELHS